MSSFLGQACARKDLCYLIIGDLAYFYDINFKATYESIRDNHYVDKIIGRIPYTNPDTGKQMEQIRNEMNLYIQNAINENGNYR